VSIAGTDPAYIVTATLADPQADGTVGIQIGDGVTDLSGNAYTGGASALYALTHWAGFTQQPVGARKYLGEAHLLEVGVVTGGLPTAYRWKHLKNDWTVVTGPAAPQWQLSQITGDDGGDYWCEVTNDGVARPSQKVTVSVAGHLRITKQPQGGGGFYGSSWTFTVETDGGFVPLHYQWRKDQQQDCPGGTQAALVISPLEAGDEGLYNVEIHDSYTDAAESNTARLTLAQRIPAVHGAALAILAAATALVGTWRSRKGRIGQP
jgi:hypothetical protein